MSPMTKVQLAVGVGFAKVYVVVDGATTVSALGRRFRYGRFLLEPYFCPTGVPSDSHVLAPEITPTWPARESVEASAVMAGAPASAKPVV